MSRLSELKQKLADEKAVVLELAAQAQRTTGGETQRLLRKREQVILSAQTTQNKIDEVLHRIVYLQVARTRAQENLVAIERNIKASGDVDSTRAGGLDRGRATLQHEIAGILRELVILDASESPA